MSEPITRSGMYLAALGGDAVTPPEPITRMDMYLAYLNGMTDTYPEPITRTEQYLYKLCQNGMGSGGGGADIARAIVERTITEYIDSEVTVLGTYAFSDCGSLHTVKVDNLLTVGEKAFQNCTSLQEIELPKAESFGPQVFVGCSALVSVNAPMAKNTPHTGFSGVKTLVSAYFPNTDGVAARCFRYCSSLVSMDFNCATMIEAEAFSGATNLRTLILRTPMVTTLKNSSSLQDTPFAENGTGGVLLVPSALVEDYKTATNWSAHYGYGTNRFLALEDYTVDGTITGEIDWDKVNALFA